MDAKDDDVEKDPQGESSEVFQPAGDAGTLSGASEPFMDNRPLVSPGARAFIPRAKGLQVITPDMAIWDVKQFDFHGPNGAFHSRQIREGILTTDFDLVLGQHEIHYRKWSDGRWRDWYNSTPFFAADPPVITTPAGKVFDTKTPTIEGRGLPWATFQLWRHQGTALGSPVTVGASGNWSLTATTPLEEGTYQIVVGQTYGGWTGTIWATPIIIQIQLPTPLEPVIRTPKEGDIITDPLPWIIGTGQTGSSIHLYEQGGAGGVYGTGTVDGSVWHFQLTKPLPNRAFVFHAEQVTPQGRRSWSNTVPVVVRLQPDRPVITSPAAGSTQNSPFTLGGTGGVVGALMEVFLDLNHSIKVGEAQITGNIWSVAVTVDPGRRSLVVRQTDKTVPSDFSQPRSFDVRPPAVSKVDVTVPGATTVKFEGDGYEGATVVITVVSGPGGAAPAQATVVGGKWQTSATNWPNGLYRMSAIQKVPDNAGGWIESAPFAFEYLFNFPLPYEVSATPEYWTTLSGKGVLGATVSLYDVDGTTRIAPDVQVGSDNRWSSKAYVEWGPTFDRIVRVRQWLNNQQSADVEYKVRIPPRAPGIDRVPPEGLSPTFTGSCESGAQVSLLFSGSSTLHSAVVSGRTWSFQRAQPFAPGVEHTVTATQVAAQQTSPAATVTFLLFLPMIPPVITEPEKDSDVGRDVTFRGTDGMKGATLFLFDYLSGSDLGSATLTADGPWEITLEKLKFGRWVVRARQAIDGQVSADSDSHPFHVVLLAPGFTSPIEDGRLLRTSTIEGEGMPLGTVDVFLQGAAEPLFEKLPIDINGKWRREVTLPVGHKTLWARQYFEDQTSRDSLPRNYSVVPAPPVLETPVSGAHVGQGEVASGFGVPGDTIIVWMIYVGVVKAGETTVQADRTWSVALDVRQPSRENSLHATASCDGFSSDGSDARNVILGTYRPVFEKPAEGQYVSDPVSFSGQGRAGTMRVRSWFNPEREWLVAVVAGGIWQGEATAALPSGGHWCQIQQSLTDDAGGATISDRVMSSRFEVLASTPEQNIHRSSDKRST
ncbi:hypothetical protein N8H74_10965 [Pseudomonas sp. B2M1-30]|uniref:hypothetical protein n=1 Tax=Pseudomonas TaxID=286 RepID=UPI0021C907CD|nr:MULTISPECIES: hypothetical protein [Pseudomonas]MCU0118777.1 hypothetical protein [Pseudomonas sp. B2M1-30]MCU7263259.1 hypothetical protein [Pseudomonas koreensis]